MSNSEAGGFVPQPVPPTTRAHELAAKLDLRVWRHVGSDGVNVYSEETRDLLVEAGAKAREFQPEAIGNPSRRAWEVILPNPYPPLEVVEDEGGT